jgi:hypothetical protein
LREDSFGVFLSPCACCDGNIKPTRYVSNRKFQEAPKKGKFFHEFFSINSSAVNKGTFSPKTINLISKMDYDKYAIGSEIDILKPSPNHHKFTLAFCDVEAHGIWVGV